MSAQAGRAAVAVLLSLEAAALTAVLAATAAGGRWWPGARLALADFILTGLAVFTWRDWRAHSPRRQCLPSPPADTECCSYCREPVFWHPGGWTDAVGGISCSARPTGRYAEFGMHDVREGEGP